MTRIHGEHLVYTELDMSNDDPPPAEQFEKYYQESVGTPSLEEVYVDDGKLRLTARVEVEETTQREMNDVLTDATTAIADVYGTYATDSRSAPSVLAAAIVDQANEVATWKVNVGTARRWAKGTISDRAFNQRINRTLEFGELSDVPGHSIEE